MPLSAPLSDEAHVVLIGPASEVWLQVVEVRSADVPPTDLRYLLRGLPGWRRAEVAPFRWFLQGFCEQIGLATPSVYEVHEGIHGPRGFPLRTGGGEQVVGSS